MVPPRDRFVCDGLEPSAVTTFGQIAPDGAVVVRYTAPDLGSVKTPVWPHGRSFLGTRLLGDGGTKYAFVACSSVVRRAAIIDSSRVHS